MPKLALAAFALALATFVAHICLTVLWAEPYVLAFLAHGGPIVVFSMIQDLLLVLRLQFYCLARVALRTVIANDDSSSSSPVSEVLSLEL